MRDRSELSAPTFTCHYVTCACGVEFVVVRDVDDIKPLPAQCSACETQAEDEAMYKRWRNRAAKWRRFSAAQNG